MNLLQIHEPGETPNPHSGGLAIGIDLGTTHSVAAFAHGGQVRVLSDADGRVLIPSVVRYDGDTVTVGTEALEHHRAADAQAIASIKRLMGRGPDEAATLHPGHILAEGQTLRLAIGGRELTPVEISADILRHMKRLAETTLGQEVTQAVITVPAYFDDAARQATRDAARLAGLDVLRLINEPTAAALAYGLGSGAEGIYAVYDLGGGTFDISILKLEKGVFQVLSTGGDRALGGDDIDHAIARHWGQGTDNRLLALARKAKEALSGQNEFHDPERNLSLTRADLDRLAAPFIERTLSLCANALDDADLDAQSLSGVVLVGGSTRLHSVVQEVTRFFGLSPRMGINPDEVVAVGAAIQADGLTAGSDTLLLDVVPLSLCLETMGGLSEKIIHRNTPIPVAASQEFTTYRDAQDGMIIHVVQGEREMVEQNRSLARFTLSGIPALPAGIARVKVTFTVDADGLLSVSAREETTGTEQQIAVKPSWGMEEGEIERMLYDSMKHAKDDIMERLLREARVDAERSIEEILSAFATDAGLLVEGERGIIEAQIARVREAASGHERELIDAEREALHHVSRLFAERRMDHAIRSALAGTHVDKV